MEGWVLPTTIILGLILIGGMYLIRRGRSKSLVALEDPQKAISVRLIRKDRVSHDTRRFRFALSSFEHTLGLPIGRHIYVSADIAGHQVSRPYTPTSLDDQKGYFELVIKVYFAGVHPKFPDGGKMSQHLERLQLGDNVLVKGPKGRLTYKGRGEFAITDALGRNERTKMVSHVGMIAGGTGITPMYQIIQAMFRDNNDKTNINLLFANQTEDDILIREELETLSKQNSDRFRLWYTLDRPGEGWGYSSGFVNEEMVRERLPPPGDEVLILICGPPPMVEYACRPNLEKAGFDLNTQMFVF